MNRRRARWIVTAVALVLGALTAAAAEMPPSLADGPYIVPARDGWRAARVGADGRVVTMPARSVRIAPVGNIPAFDVPLRPAPPPEASAQPFDDGTPLLVLADTHGEYDILVSLLRRQAIIGSDLGWAFGRGHLVVTGDMLDRGPHQLEILWLLYKLEAEARRAGGRVHVLLGNHETMQLRGDLRYINPRYVKVAAALGASSYAELLGPATVLGAWLRSKPAVFRLGDMLFLHGGISPAVTQSRLSLDVMNDGVRTAFGRDKAAVEADPTLSLVMGRAGPLWYRGYFPLDDKPPTATAAEIDASLARFGVKRIFVGHTIVEKVMPLYDGRIVAVQVYPEYDKATGEPLLEGALRLGGRWYRVTAQGARIPLDL